MRLIRKKNKTAGFNLIELMIVIVILASLVTLGVVKYNSYSKRAGIVAVANHMEGVKAKVALYFANHNDTPPNDQSQINIGSLDSNTSKFISSLSYNKGSSGLPNNVIINVNNGAILAYVAADFTSTITGSSSSFGRVYYVASVGNDAEVTWSCFTQGLDANYIPQNCKTTGSGTGSCGGTNIWNGSSCGACLTGATCSGGIITICPTGFYGTSCANAVSSCAGYVKGTGEQATCITPCPSTATCSNGRITGCNPGYYGSDCATQCLGTISGDWSTGSCIPCSGTTPYWNGTSCAACPSNANCSNGGITSCTNNYYGSTCSQQCHGTISNGNCIPCPSAAPFWNGTNCTQCPAATPSWDGTSCQACPIATPLWNGSICQACPIATPFWNGTSCQACSGSTPYWNGSSCQPCPPKTNCSGGGISGCQAGYYGPGCNTLCTGIISGSWPHLTCQQCSGTTPYWNGSTCQQCPASATCSNGSITSCSNGFTLTNGTCQCTTGLAVVAVNTLNNTTICYSQCPWGSVLSGGTGETIGVSSCRCVNSGLAADLRNQSCSVSCSAYLPLYVGSARIENRVDQVRGGWGGGYCSYGTDTWSCSACSAWGYYTYHPHSDGRSCICGS